MNLIISVFNPCSFFLFYILLIHISITDILSHRIPDHSNTAILILGIIKLVIVESNRSTYLCGIFAVSVPLLLIAILSKGGIGGGDIKLSAACGLYLGTKQVLYGTCFGIILAGLYVGMKIICKKMNLNSRVALGPFLGIGYLLTFLFSSYTFTYL